MLSTVQVLAGGFTGNELMQLQIDQQAVQAWTVAGSENGNDVRSYVYQTADTITGDQVRVAFLNDVFVPATNTDYNLRVDAIIIDGQRFETEAADVFSTGTWLPADGITPGFRQSELLQANGYFQFGNTSQPVTGSLVEVRVRGDEGPESFTLQIGGQNVLSESNVGTDFRSYFFQADQPVVASDVRVAFTNDLYVGGSTDYNLTVDLIRIDGTTYQTEDPSTLSTGTWINGGFTDGFWQFEQLHVNGYFAYGQDNNSTNRVTIRARGDEGSEDFSLQIAGETVASWNDISSAFSDYTYQSATPIDINDVRVVLLNSQYDPANGIDANLVVDFVSIGGQTYQTESSLVFSTGTWTAADGIVPGFRQNETLHEVGYLQFADQSQDTGSFALDSNLTIVDEESDSIEVVVNRLEGSSGIAQIDYNTVPITATPGVDYTPVSGRLTFADGETSKSVSVPILPDNENEDAQTFSFVIENPQGGAGLLSPRTMTIEISDSPNTGEPGELAPGTPELNLTTEVIASVGGSTAIDWTPDGSQMFIADFGGLVYVYEDGQLLSEPFINISDQVNGVRGMLDLAVHPDFENNPYVYLAFAYDPPEVYQNTGLAGPDGAGNRASRVIRVTADVASGYRTAVAGSDVIVAGSNSLWHYYNGAVDSTVDLDEPAGGYLADGTNVQDFLAADSQSHTIGAIEFGPDGALYIANGDGASYNAVDVRATRVQDIDNLSGKVLRVDPLTGQGLADNPFYNGDPDANRSKVYQYGLRNPFRITFDNAGQLYVGDVGWTQWEEINAGEPGANFGWPFYEGGNGQNLPTLSYRDLPAASAFYNSNPNITAPLLGLDHVDAEIDAIILGEIYDGTALPSQYQGMLIFNHLATGFVRAVEFDATGVVANVRTLTQGPAFVTQISTGPDGELYFVNFGSGEVGRFVAN